MTHSLEEESSYFFTLSHVLCTKLKKYPSHFWFPKIWRPFPYKQKIKSGLIYIFQAKKTNIIKKIGVKSCPASLPTLNKLAKREDPKWPEFLVCTYFF